MDISGDSKLIVTCSADKNVKIWGLDFGDCHRSIFAHDESVMRVAFEKHDTRDFNAKPSHYFWTVGKDKMVKYWDGDKVCEHTLFTFLCPELIVSTVREYSKIGWPPWRDMGTCCQQPGQICRHGLKR